MAELLREIPRIKQTNDSPLQRRWFTCASADLFIWYREACIEKFEFCYNQPHAERSLTWTATGGFTHSRIDDGESNPLKNQTPMAIPQSHVDRDDIALRVESLAASIEPAIYRFIMRVLWLGR